MTPAPPSSASPSAAVVVVSPDELRDLVRSAVREALAEARTSSGSTSAADEHEREWLDSAGAARLLGVSSRQIAKLAAAGKLPSARVGRLLRFRRADVLSLLAAR